MLFWERDRAKAKDRAKQLQESQELKGYSKGALMSTGKNQKIGNRSWRNIAAQLG